MPSFDRKAKQAEPQRGRARTASVQRPAASGGVGQLASSPAAVLGLQRSIGNVATNARLQRAPEEEEKPMQLSRLQRIEEEEPLQKSQLQRVEEEDEQESTE